MIGSEPLPIPSKTAPETLSDARSCHASPLVDTRTPTESTPSSSQPCQVGNLGLLLSRDQADGMAARGGMRRKNVLVLGQPASILYGRASSQSGEG